MNSEKALDVAQPVKRRASSQRSDSTHRMFGAKPLAAKPMRRRRFVARRWL